MINKKASAVVTSWLWNMKVCRLQAESAPSSLCTASHINHHISRKNANTFLHHLPQLPMLSQTPTCFFYDHSYTMKKSFKSRLSSISIIYELDFDRLHRCDGKYGLRHTSAWKWASDSEYVNQISNVSTESNLLKAQSAILYNPEVTWNSLNSDIMERLQ